MGVKWIGDGIELLSQKIEEKLNEGAAAAQHAAQSAGSVTEAVGKLQERPPAMDNPDIPYLPFTRTFPFVRNPFWMLFPVYICFVFMTLYFCWLGCKTLFDSSSANRKFKKQAAEAGKRRKMQRKQLMKQMVAQRETEEYQRAYYDQMKTTAAQGGKLSRKPVADIPPVEDEMTLNMLSGNK